MDSDFIFFNASLTAEIKDTIDSKKTLEEKVLFINELKKYIHSLSPFSKEPVDCVLWEKSELLKSNEYNPNVVSPPEMKLLELSIMSDGYTQPIVAWNNGDGLEIVDGFHRSKIGKESTKISNRIHGYLPIVPINKERENKNDRIASTIRHNRARGKHIIPGMTAIVIELKQRGWSDARISKELGMNSDEVLRLQQINGISELFENEEYSQAWEINNFIDDGIENIG